MDTEPLLSSPETTTQQSATPQYKIKSLNYQKTFNIHKTKIMASGAISSWQIEGEKGEAVTDFIFLSSKITVHGDFSHEIKRHLLLGRKVMTNLLLLLLSRFSCV